MTVNELIELLQECQPGATVRIMTQKSWPFENSVRGICTRDWLDEECDCDHRSTEPHDDGCSAAGGYKDGLTEDDVFIVEGQQERYGSKSAWAVATR